MFLVPKMNTLGQICINEASCRNASQVFDEDGESKDWFELYNLSANSVDLGGWTISDNPAEPAKWTFPGISMDPGSFLVVFASGKNRYEIISGQKWETAVLPSDLFRYIVPGAGTPGNWNTPGFNDASWGTGQAGFGYGDGDDNTTVPDGTISIYIRRTFTIPDTSALFDAVCHFDYDDGFVAYLNGVEICRRNINGDPSWDSYASNLREAGGTPEAFPVDRKKLKSCWNEGENVFAVEVHNYSNTSSDLSLIPYLSFSMLEESFFFSPAPIWFAGSLDKNLHTNFKLDLDGETLYLYSDAGTKVDTLYVARTPVDYSVGRVTDGDAETGVFKMATPGETNNTSTAYTNGYEPYPIITPGTGFYTNPVEVTIATYSPTAVIRYTLDGSEPVSSSPVYTGDPILVNSSTALRARCFSTTNKLDGISVASTYFIGEAYSLPVLSVMTDNENLYGTSGIFTHWDQSWNIPCYFQYFDENKKIVLSQEAGMQVDGGAGGSRSQPQHSFRIEPDNGTFGEGSARYRLLPDRPERDSYTSFYLRNGSNQYLILPYKDGVEVKGMGKNTYTYYSAYRPVAVHINGEFFGIYELREKLNDDFLLQNCGIPADSLDLLGVSYFKGMTLQAQEGTIEPFLADLEYFRGLNTTDPDFIEKTESFLDLKNYTDYIIGQTWIANTDWPYNNIKLFRSPKTDYKWRFILLDLEWSLRPNEWSTAETDHIAFLKDQGTGNDYTVFWYRLMQTEEYRNYFINRMADLMNTNYKAERLLEIEQEIFEEIEPMMPLEYERWGNSNIEGQMNNFLNNHQIFRSELSKRSSRVRSHLQNHYGLSNQMSIELDVNPPGSGRIKISTILPDSYPWSGIYFSDIPVTIKAIPYPGYVFDGWDPHSLISDTDAVEFTAEFVQKTGFTANFIEGENEFEGVTISEISYKGIPGAVSSDWFELFNATSSTLNLDGWYFRDNDPAHVYSFPAGTAILPGERLVVAQDTKVFSLTYPEVKNYCGDFPFGLDEYNDKVTIFNAAGNVVVSASYSNVYPWPLYDVRDGSTLELLDPAADLGDPENWVRGCPLGSPGQPYMICYYTGTGPERTEPLPPSGSGIIAAYPNPATDRVTLRLYQEEEQGNVEVRIYSVMGQLLGRFTENNVGTGIQEIPVSFEGISGDQMLYIIVSAGKWTDTVKVVRKQE